MPNPLGLFATPTPQAGLDSRLARLLGAMRLDAAAREQRGHTIAQLLTSAGRIVIVILAALLILDIFISIGPLLAGGVEGTVERMTLRMVVLRDGAGGLHYVANSSISAVTNLSRPHRAQGATR